MADEMRPSPSGTRDIDGLSPPRDLSSTTAMAEQQIQLVQNEALRNSVQAFAKDHPACSLIPLFSTYSCQTRPVEEVAKDLVGHFLICRESNVVMRIVETEAYQEGEELFKRKFSKPHPDFKSAAGRVVGYPVLFNQYIMLITTGELDSKDVVLLRTCSAVHGHDEIAMRVSQELPTSQSKLDNMIASPLKVYSVLKRDLGSNCNLLEPSSGFYVAQKDTNPLILLDGPRILRHKSMSQLTGADSRFRFSFADCAPTLTLKSELRPIENQPDVQRSTEERLPASDGSIG